MTGGIPHRTWYEITGAQIGDRRVKVYKVTCNQCPAMRFVRPGKMTDEQVQRYFERLGWRIGRHPDQHRCPNHYSRKILQPVTPHVSPRVAAESLFTKPAEAPAPVATVEAVAAVAREMAVDEIAELKAQLGVTLARADAAEKRVNEMGEKLIAYERTIEHLRNEIAGRDDAIHVTAGAKPEYDVVDFSKMRDEHQMFYSLAEHIIAHEAKVAARMTEAVSASEHMRRAGIEPGDRNRSMMSKALRIMRTDPSLRDKSIFVAERMLNAGHKPTAPETAPREKQAPARPAAPRRHINPLADLARLQAMIQPKK